MKRFSIVLLALLFTVFFAGAALASSMPIANPNSMISASQLMDLIGKDDNLIIIGVINPRNALIPFSASARPIEGSYLVWRDDYSGGGTAEAISPEVTGFRKSQKEMEELLSKAGVTVNSNIVVYAADSMHDSARFVWQLKLLGLTNVKYLDGGINAWIDAGLPTGKGKRLSAESPKSEFKAPSYDPKKYDAPMQLVAEALQKPDEWVVIDARSKDEYDGKKTSSSSGAYGTGRMKGAVHINWTSTVDSKTQLLKSREELEAIYGDVIKGKKVIAFCQSGVRSAHTHMVLTEVLGAKDVYNYNGSWIEWSYAASQASGAATHRNILELTEEWSDNKKPL
jgi:thiosulfate/3-mercaptopyruvate sulfurtransferase